ncbi:MAG: spermidine/putrescine ABC transporter substrate-binding protein [Candidatus Tectomicrobia bacterium]|uniref:Spermidine/putrescine ABC transporter substrate-binding protein n=1 Tax=Tectimicrobiota bacterium TaxID=2528274 RepID=A0A938B0Q3_UNCTE|nr:spermidine/putrescine ABC transporter substrate-binding protein [Candidatus Tectomicrobia bacterium]
MNRPARRQLETWVEALGEGRLTRRTFLRRGLALGVTLPVLADIVRLYTPAAAETAPTPQLLERIKKEGRQLFIANWEEYVHPHTIPRFAKEFGVKVTYDTFPGNEQLLAKLQAGGARYDVIFPTHNFLPIYRAQGLLAPLNHEYLPLFSNLLDKFRQTSFDPGNTYTVPYSWGMTGLAHHTVQTRDDPRLGSWALLFESGPQRYSGKLGLTDEREEVVAAALQFLGQPPNTHSREALREAGALLLRLKPHIKAFYPGVEAKKALITEDLVVAQSWSGETVKAQAKNPAVAWALPREGGTGWFDAMAMPKVAPHKVTAQAFMNYMLRPEVAAENANTTGYATANRIAVEKYIDPQVAGNPAIYPPAETLARVTFLETIPDDVLPVYEDIWTRLLGA